MCKILTFLISREKIKILVALKYVSCWSECYESLLCRANKNCGHYWVSVIGSELAAGHNLNNLEPSKFDFERVGL